MSKQSRFANATQPDGNYSPDHEVTSWVGYGMLQVAADKTDA
jgi:hypothetical protein